MTTSMRPTVLIVEDQAVMRQSAVEMVQDAGFAALEADNAARAMELIDALPEIRVVMTDVDMPSSIDGIKLAACIHRKWPAIGIVIVSGKVAPKLGDVPNRGYFFQKPYNEAAVVAAIRQLMTD